MGSDQAKAACVAARDISNAPASSQQDCADVLHLSVFFDGTGNNKDVDEPTRKWSNVARIHRAAEMLATRGSSNHAVYISGVGTPFNGKPLDKQDGHRISVEDNYTGGFAGHGGTRRLDFGLQQVNDALTKVLVDRAKTLGQTVEKHAADGKRQSFSEVASALAQHRLIKQINVSIFGFSRGAALARAFCNQWLWKCEDNRGQLLYEGHPIRFVFLGCFDTVASFGLAATNLANIAVLGGFKGRDLVVDDRVERCVHFVAAHELRFSFPVDLIRRGGKTDGRWLEKAYPGVHSDVGGGYLPDDQGISNNYARIPMRDMMREAALSGCRVHTDQEIRALNFPLFQERFECLPATEAAYKSYMARCNATGSIEQQMRAHMKLLYSGYGTLHRKGIETVTQRQHREGKSWTFGPDDMATELQSYQEALREIVDPKLPLSTVNPAGHVFRVKAALYAAWISPEKWQIDAWNTQADSGVANFINSFIHDSKVGFLKNAEPFSYFSHRGVDESNRSVKGWFETNVIRPVDASVEKGVDYTKAKATEAKEAVEDAVDEAKQKAAEVKRELDAAAHRAQKAVQDTAAEVKKDVEATARSVKKAASDTADAVSKKVSRGAAAVSKATQDAVKSLSTAWDVLWGGG